MWASSSATRSRWPTEARGAKVVGDRVYLDRALVRELIATIPSGWTYRARNPDAACPSAASIRSSCR
jgi:trimethylamine:corrinoid methyltransferase-like protein